MIYSIGFTSSRSYSGALRDAWRPARPSGIKRPKRDLPTNDRLAFGALSRLFTAVRWIGYYEKYLTGERRDDLEGLARLED